MAKLAIVLVTSLNVRAIHAGDAGPNAANAIATEGSLSVDIRMAPGEDPMRVEKITEAYLTSKGWTIVRETPDAATKPAHPKVLQLN